VPWRTELLEQAVTTEITANRPEGVEHETGAGQARLAPQAFLESRGPFRQFGALPA
jgi:hypothetical protein